MNKSDTVILNGFDRSGSSAISRLLNLSDDVELLMQPFNSGIIRKKMYVPFNEPNTNEAYLFLEGLKNGKIRNDLVKSHWHFKHSSTLEFKPNKLHIVKTTINHFAQEWMKVNFPEIDVWGIWRNPLDILKSLVYNEFNTQWYNDALAQIKPTVHKVNILNDFEKYLDKIDSEVKATAFLIAVRTFYFLYYLDEDKLLDYEKFKADANYLNKFNDYYNLSEVDYAENSKIDLNILGKRRSNEYNLDTDDENFAKDIFGHIIDLKKQKFDD